MSFLFDQSSISEFSFIYEGKIGRIDKIAFKENDIWIVDFKTGRFSNSPEIPTDYVQQLSFYKKALNEVLAEDFSKSNKNIKTAILWTKTIKLVEISDT